MAADVIPVLISRLSENEEGFTNPVMNIGSIPARAGKNGYQIRVVTGSLDVVR
jgi:hypothetical protein